MATITKITTSKGETRYRVGLRSAHYAGHRHRRWYQDSCTDAG